MYYVTMTDKFLSGWGKAENKIAKFINICNNYEEALIVFNNAKDRGDQKHINICTKKPYYNKKYYYIEYKTKKDTPNWYIKDYFKKS